MVEASPSRGASKGEAASRSSPEDSEGEGRASGFFADKDLRGEAGSFPPSGLSEEELLAACRAGVATLTPLCDDAAQACPPSAFIVTASGTRVDRRCLLYGSEQIAIAGNSVLCEGVSLRGDLAPMRLGRFLFVGKNTALHPCSCLSKGEPRFVPLVVGDFVQVGQDCVVKAASIGDCVSIGDRCVVGNRAIIRDCAVLLDDSVLPPDAVVPPLTVFGGRPARFVADLPEAAGFRLKERARRAYFLFASQPPQSPPTADSRQRQSQTQRLRSDSLKRAESEHASRPATPH